MSSALRMVQPALGKQLTKMNFGGIGDKLKEQQAAERAAEKPADKPALPPNFEPLAALKNTYIPGRDGPVKTPAAEAPAAGTPPKPGERAPRGERLRAARRRARRTGRRSLLAASRLRRAEETGTQQRTLG